MSLPPNRPLTLIICLASGPEEQSLHQVSYIDTATLYYFMLADFFFHVVFTQIKLQVFLNARRQKKKSYGSYFLETHKNIFDFFNFIYDFNT